MTILGKKFGSLAHKFGKKLHINQIKKFGTKAIHDVDKGLLKAEHLGKKFGKKAIHGVDKGLVIANKVVGGVEKGIRKASNIAGKLEGVPVLGEFAGMASSGLKQLGSGVHVAHKGVAGLEKGVRKVESLGKTIHRGAKNIKSGNDDNVAQGIKDIAGGFHGMKRRG